MGLVVTEPPAPVVFGLVVPVYSPGHLDIKLAPWVERHPPPPDCVPRVAGLRDDLKVWIYLQRLAIAKEFGDKAAERRAYSNLGNAHIFLGRFDVAAEHYK